MNVTLPSGDVFKMNSPDDAKKKLDDISKQMETLEMDVDRLRSICEALGIEVKANTHGRGFSPGRPKGISNGGVREQLAKLIEQNGPSKASDLARIVNRTPSNVLACLRGMQNYAESGWFTQINGYGSAYTLTEKGRNRHAKPKE